MPVARLLDTLAGQHLLPALLSSALIFLALLLAFWAGLRRPGQRALLLTVALAKVVLLVWQGEEVSCLRAGWGGRVGSVSMTLPSALPSSWDNVQVQTRGIPRGSELANEMLWALLVLTAVLLCYRWLRLAPVYRALRGASHPANDEFPQLCRAFEELAARAQRRDRWLPRPRLLVVRGATCTAFTMGLLPPVIVLSSELAEQMGRRELLGVLAHELAHTKRLDYLARWLATVLRDLVVWNPFAWAWHRQLLEEQERASDELAADLLDDPAAVAGGLVEVSAYARRAPLLGMGPLSAWQRSAGRDRLEQRLLRLEAKSSGGSEGWPRAVFWPVSILFAAAQPHIVLPISQWARMVLG